MELSRKTKTRAEVAAEAAPDPQADTDALLIDHEYRLVMLELGVTTE